MKKQIPPPVSASLCYNEQHEVSVCDVSFSYTRKEVLRNVNFRARGGEVTALLGENGAGKTTLFRLILGFTGKYTGTIYIDGKDNRLFSARERARKIAYIPQSQQQVFNYPVLLAVLMGRTASVNGLRGPSARDEQAALAALESLGIAHLAERGFAEISGGERQLALIARALAQDARILVMDEPAANLDYGNQIRVLQKIRALAASGFCVIVSTHNPDHALQFADNAVVLRGGAMSAGGSPIEVINAAMLRAVYGVNAEVKTVDCEGKPRHICMTL
jgi:iron complex transport system ATP-binding protein